MNCRSCGCVDVEPVVINVSVGPHEGKLICPECNAFLEWAKKKKNEGHRTVGSKHTVESLGKTCCELCRRPPERLGKYETLERHHLDCKGLENDVPENIMVVCTACHKQIHHNIVYLNEHYAHMFTDTTMTEINYEEVPF